MATLTVLSSQPENSACLNWRKEILSKEINGEERIVRWGEPNWPMWFLQSI